MKLLIVFTAILAISFAKEKREIIEDSEAEASASVELLKEGSDLKTAASSYNTYVPPSQRPPQWNAPNYVPPQNNWIPPNEEKPVNSVPAEVQSDEYHHHHYYPAPVQQWPTKPVEQWPTKPVQQWTTQAPQWTKPASQWTTQAPQWTKPAPQWTTPAPQWTTQAPQWTSPVHHPTPTTTPVAVIKNEQYYGDNGDYKYEYQIADGTHVGEQGYYTDPKQTDESLVKKGWYSFVGADGKTYTVHYWADKTGFHAYGDHLPTPPTPHPAIQAAIDKQKEAEKNKPQHDYPTQTQAPVYYPTPAPVYYPSQAPVYNTQQNYNPPQNYNPQQNYNHQQTYNPTQQAYYPQQQTYN